MPLVWSAASRPCTFHVVYWEAGDEGEGIKFDKPLDARASGGGSGQPSDSTWPRLCGECDGVVEPWRCPRSRLVHVAPFVSMHDVQEVAPFLQAFRNPARKDDERRACAVSDVNGCVQLLITLEWATLVQ